MSKKIYHYRVVCMGCHVTTETFLSNKLEPTTQDKRWCPKCQEYTQQQVFLDYIEKHHE